MDGVERSAVAKQYTTTQNLDMQASPHETYEVADRDW